MNALDHSHHHLVPTAGTKSPSFPAPMQKNHSEVVTLGKPHEWFPPLKIKGCFFVRHNWWTKWTYTDSSWLWLQIYLSKQEVLWQAPTCQQHHKVQATLFNLQSALLQLHKLFLQAVDRVCLKQFGHIKPWKAGKWGDDFANCSQSNQVVTQNNGSCWSPKKCEGNTSYNRAIPLWTPGSLVNIVAKGSANFMNSSINFIDGANDPTTLKKGFKKKEGKRIFFNSNSRIVEFPYPSFNSNKPTIPWNPISRSSFFPTFVCPDTITA